MRDDSPEILFQSFLREAIVNSSGMGSGVHSLTLSIRHFLCLPERHPSSKVPCMMVSLGAVVACDLPEPCKFPSLDICQKRFLWTHKEVGLIPHPVVDLCIR